MSKVLLKNTFLYTVGNFLPKVTGFLLLPLYSFYLKPDEYGILSGTNAVVGLLAIMLILAIPRSIPRLFWDYSSPEKNKIFYGTIFISVFVIASFQVAIIFLLNDVVGKVYKDISFFPYIAYGIIIAYLSSFFAIANSYYRQIGNASVFIRNSLLNFAFITIGAVLMLLVFNNGAISVLKGRMFGSIIILLLTLFIARKIAVLKFDKKIFKAIMIFSLPLLPANLFAWIMKLSDRVFIEHYFDLSTVGLYSMGYQIVIVGSLLLNSMKQAYDPWFFQQATLNTKEARKKITLGNNTISLMMLIVVFFISLFAKDGIDILLSEEYHSIYKYIPVLSLSIFFASFSGLMNLAFYQEKKTMYLMWIFAFAAIINISLNFVLIPTYGAMGAAWATTLTFLTEFLIKYIISNKFYKLGIIWKPIIFYLSIMSSIVILFNYFEVSWYNYILILLKGVVFIFITFFIFYKRLSFLRLLIAKK